MLYFHDGFSNPSVSQGEIIAYVAITTAITIALYILRSIGLFVMAKRAGIKHAFIAWIPCAWMFTACKLIGNKVLFMGKPISKLAIIFCVIFSVSELCVVLIDAITYFPLIGNYLMGRDIYIVISSETEPIKGLTQYMWMADVYYDSSFVNPYGNAVYAIDTFLRILNYVSIPFDIANIFVVITVYVNLFKRYLPNHYLLAAIVSLLGFFAPFVFAVRKREPMNYIDYLRSRYQHNPYYGNPYANNPQGQQGQRSPEHPFSEFAGRGEVDPGDPFNEFKDDKKDDN